MKKILYLIISIIILSLIWWFQYLVNIFPLKYTLSENQVEQLNITSEESNSAIIVLTGAKGRFEKGFTLLEKKISNKMFVSGVYPGVNLEKKYDHLIKNENFFECCIFFGNNAFNTKQNADEVIEWIKENEINKIFLVTSYYHLPRAKVIFEEKIPLDITMIYIPSDKFQLKLEDTLYLIYNFKLIVLEYFKILYTFIFF